MVDGSCNTDVQLQQVVEKGRQSAIGVLPQGRASTPPPAILRCGREVSDLFPSARQHRVHDEVHNPPAPVSSTATLSLGGFF